MYKLVIPSVILQIIDLQWACWKNEFNLYQMKIWIVNCVLILFILKSLRISLWLIVLSTIIWASSYAYLFSDKIYNSWGIMLQIVILQSLLAFFINEENAEYHANLIKFYQSEYNWSIIKNSVSETLEESMGLSSLHANFLKYSDIWELFTTYIQWAKSIVSNFPAGIMFYSLEKGSFYTNKLLQAMDV